MVHRPLKSLGYWRPLASKVTDFRATSIEDVPIRQGFLGFCPYIGIVGTLLGAILSLFGSRVTSFGLADLRGGLHVGFDEGVWMTTSFGVGQMLIGVACPYLGAILGVRRVLLLGMILLCWAPPNLNAFLAAQFMAGVGSGTFIPLSIGFIVRNLPTKLTVYGIAIYAMNLFRLVAVSFAVEVERGRGP
jgi:DHA2 family multidrug resistance protein